MSVYRRVPSSALRPGMIVLAPSEVNDPDLGPVALSAVWPDHPRELIVRLWYFEEGETELVGANGSIDYNTQDLPAFFGVREDSWKAFHTHSTAEHCPCALCCEDDPRHAGPADLWHRAMGQKR